MHKLRTLGICSLLGICLYGTGRTFIHRHNDSRLSAVAFGYTYAGAPLTGIIYSLHSPFQFSRLQTVWKGKLDGLDYQWYANGQMMVERRYKNGLEHGVQKTWHPTGEPQSLSSYIEGKRDGESWAWHAAGSTKNFALHRDGEEIAIKSFSHRKVPFHNYVKAGGEPQGMMGDKKCDRPKLARIAR